MAHNYFALDIFEERAAIYEFEGGLDKENAELMAVEAVLKQWPELATDTGQI